MYHPSLTNMNLHQIVSFCVLVTLCCVASEVTNCPAGCTCTSQDKVIIRCSPEASGQTLPTEFPSNVQALHLSNYPLVNIPSFKSLTRLQEFSLQYCQIRTLDQLEVQELSNLNILDLRYNDIEKLPLIEGTNIEVLHIGHNKLKSLNTSNLGPTPNLKELHLDNNAIESLYFGESFPNLEKLHLDNNKISDIGYALTNLSHFPRLNSLNLSSNILSTLGSFPKMSHLQYLDISNNSLTEVEDNMLLNLSSLVSLNLRHNQLLSVPNGLPMLEHLDLSHNKIIHILEVQKSDVYPIEVFNFAHNPLHCDCHMLWLKELFDQREYLVKHISIPASEFIPSCASPGNMKGESWDQLGDTLFTCDKPLTQAKGGKPDLIVKSGKVTGDSIEIYWSWTVKGPLAYSTVYIQYYVFGLRSETKRHIQVALAQRQYTLKNLRPLSNYIICVVPREDQRESSEIPQPQSLEDCLEIETKSGEPIQVLTLFYIVTYYFLGMSATIITIFAGIGLIALLYGAYASKSDWSAKYVPVDEPTTEEDEHRDQSKPEHPDTATETGDSSATASGDQKVSDTTQTDKLHAD